MSKYMIDKLLRTIDATDTDLDEFRRDPAGFLDRWEEAARHPEPPSPEGGTLTAEERTAFETLDYERLYVLGAHPYLLWMSLRSLWEAEGKPIEQLVAQYREAVERHGYPGYVD